MLISADVKGLEVVTAAWLSGDEVLRQEILDGVDIHATNQKAFDLGEGKEGRLVAKRFKFKMIYGGSAGGFANDHDFSRVKLNKAGWERVIDDYYSKYKGIARWHEAIRYEAMSTGYLSIPSGRVFDYRKMLQEPEWFYLPKIKNYPVQGFGADIVMIARISLFRRWQPEFGKLVNTIHDSIVLDIPKKEWYNISMVVRNVFKDLPANLSKTFDINWDLPLEVELKQLNGEEIT
jgi:DNA polymerase I-like protein with 3'-5' exonuclease and polymerase domains